MRRFILKIFFFGLAIIIGCFFLSEIEFSDSYIVYKTKDTAYKKIAWNINLLKNNEERIKGSIVFLGSSIVQGGINDSLLNNSGINAINMGVPHNGNEIGLYFIERLKDKKPSSVILLKGKTPYQGLHKMTPLLFRSTKLLQIGQNINLDFIKYLFKRTKLSLEYIFYVEQNESYESSFKTFLERQYGVVYDKNEISQEVYHNIVISGIWSRNDEYFNLYKNDFLYLNEQNDAEIVKMFKIFKRKITRSFYVENNFLNNSKCQQKFVDQSIELALSRNISIEKIYIPILIDVNYYEGYKRSIYGSSLNDKIGIIDFESYNFLKTKEYWADENHLSENGSVLFTSKLLAKLKDRD